MNEFNKTKLHESNNHVDPISDAAAVTGISVDPAAFATSSCCSEEVALIMLRNGDKAMNLAKHLNDLAQGHDPKILRILAAAYAEMGKFTEAASTAKQALTLAQSQSDTALTKDLQIDIRDYEAHTPLRSTSDF